MLEILLTLTLTLNLGTLVVLVKQLEACKAEMKRWKIFHRLRSFFKGKKSVSAAQPMDVHDVQPQNESQMVDEHDRSTKSEDLNLKDWPLEDSFKPVSNFLDSMPSNSQDTEPERSIRTPSPSLVSSSKRSSLHEASIQFYQKQDQQLEALEQQMGEISISLVQSEIRMEKLLARVLAQMQSINAEVQAHLRNAEINVSNDVKSELLTPLTKDMGVDPISLDTTTIGITDTLPEYHAGDNGLRERNLHSSDTKNERISISPSTPLSQDSVSNSHFPGTMSLTSTTKLLPNLRKDSFEPHSAKRGLQDIIQVDPPVFINWLPGGSAKTRPTGHRRGRPPRTDCEHSWKKVLLSLYDGRCRGRPPRQVLSWSLRPKGHRRGRPPNNYSSLETDPVSKIFFIGFPDASCLLHVLLLLDGDVYPVQIPLYFFSRGEVVSSTPNPFSLQFLLVIAIFILMKVLND